MDSVHTTATLVLFWATHSTLIVLLIAVCQHVYLRLMFCGRLAQSNENRTPSPVHSRDGTDCREAFPLEFPLKTIGRETLFVQEQVCELIRHAQWTTEQCWMDGAVFLSGYWVRCWDRVTRDSRLGSWQIKAKSCRLTNNRLVKRRVLFLLAVVVVVDLHMFMWLKVYQHCQTLSGRTDALFSITHKSPANLLH